MKHYTLLLSLSVLLFATTACDNTPEPDFVIAPVYEGVKVIEDQVNGSSIILAGNSDENYIVSYLNETNTGESISGIQAVQNALPVLFKDAEGNEWDFFGRALSGPRVGQQLTPTQSTMGYWFSFGAIYPGCEIYGQPSEFPTDVDLSPNDSLWSVNTQYVHAGSGADGIQCIEDPTCVMAGDIQVHAQHDTEPYYLKREDLIIGLRIGDEIRAYPHSILNVHEIANDIIGGEPVAMIYCPLTGTASAWGRSVGDVVTTYGVSGLLYNNNILPYDRATWTVWSQILGEAVYGDHIGERPQQFGIVETTWATWQKMYPESQVLSDSGTGFPWDYTEYPYGDYRTNNDYLLFPIAYDDTRIPRKERVHGITVGDKAKVYRFTDFN